MSNAKEVFGPFLNGIFYLYTWFVTRKFKHVGNDCSIRPVLNTTHPENISLGNDVSIGILSWIATNTTLHKEPKLIIGNRVHIGAYAVITAANEIRIGNNVLMSERVTILDHIHDYTDNTKAVIDQPIVSKGKIIIEDDCFIGINSAIIGGVKIGKHVVIGANSVVTHDIPEYSVVAGSPAKIIKRYDKKRKIWIRV